MHNKRTYTRVLTYAYTRIDICVYAKYERIIRVCVVRIYLSCTVDPLIAFTQASYRNMKSYFTSKLSEHNKNK